LNDAGSSALYVCVRSTNARRPGLTVPADCASLAASPAGFQSPPGVVGGARYSVRISARRLNSAIRLPSSDTLL
jgi:hypothetical protein